MCMLNQDYLLTGPLELKPNMKQKRDKEGKMPPIPKLPGWLTLKFESTDCMKSVFKP